MILKYNQKTKEIKELILFDSPKIIKDISLLGFEAELTKKGNILEIKLDKSASIQQQENIKNILLNYELSENKSTKDILNINDND